MVPEGGNMTIFCLALGNPIPKISLYVGGHLVREDFSRHMVTTIQNVTREMEHVACHADNGYGLPQKAGKRVSISCKLVFFIQNLRHNDSIGNFGISSNVIQCVCIGLR